MYTLIQPADRLTYKTSTTRRTKANYLEEHPLCLKEWEQALLLVLKVSSLLEEALGNIRYDIKIK